MHVLVVGGAGYIGSHMVDRLVAAGKEKVVVVDSLVTGHRAAVNPAAKFYQGDLADQDVLNAPMLLVGQVELKKINLCPRRMLVKCA